jgi:tetratricopeptide (TPR) repeat protein
MTGNARAALTRGHLGATFATTSGGLAMSNLQAQIQSLDLRAATAGLSVGEQSELIELVALRGHILGRIADVEWAEAHADALCASDPDDGLALVSRARSRARFHRFQDALCDLDEARRLGAEPAVVDAERAGILQAIGEFDAALAHFAQAAEDDAGFVTLGALATLHAERGETSVAEMYFDASRNCYRGVSPIPLALLDFQRGHMWMAQGDLHRARTWFSTAHDLLQDYAPAAGHLAEVDAELGERESAIDRLRALAASSDDPDYAASLARILAEDDEAEAHEWRLRAAARFDALMERHPEAFADHAAAFWLEVGGDADRALRLARMNLQIRGTPRAHDLVARASRAASDIVCRKERM